MKRLLFTLQLILVASSMLCASGGLQITSLRKGLIFNMPLVLEWTESTTLASDFGDGSHIGTATGTPAPTYSTADGVDLDGIDQHIVIADDNLFSHGDGSSDSAFSVTAWANMDDATSFRVISKGILNTDAEYAFGTAGADTLTVSIYDESVASCLEGIASDSTLTTYEDTWVHLGFSYDGTGGVSASTGLTLYVDGLVVASSDNSTCSGSYVAMENLTGPVWIGRVSASYANGQIQDLEMWNRELSAAEMLADKNRGRGQ
jgi:hypothetical protein